MCSCDWSSDVCSSDLACCSETHRQSFWIVYLLPVLLEPANSVEGQSPEIESNYQTVHLSNRGPRCRCPLYSGPSCLHSSNRTKTLKAIFVVDCMPSSVEIPWWNWMLHACIYRDCIRRILFVTSGSEVTLTLYRSCSFLLVYATAMLHHPMPH